MTQKSLSLITATLLLTTYNYAEEVLEPITLISSTKTSQSIKDVTSDNEVITAEELKEKHFTNVIEALNTINGIDITSNGGLGQMSAVRIHGMHYGNTLVLIDGIRYNDITNGSAFLENILTDDIEQIEIIKGAQSGIWGADASGGVINIITKKPRKNGLSGSLHTEYGSFNTKKYGASLSYKGEKAYVQLGEEKITSDGFSSKSPKGENISQYEDDGYKNTTHSIKTGFQLNDTNKIDISHKIIDSDIEYDGSSPDASNDKIDSKSTFSSINFNHIDSFNEVDIYANKSSFNRKDPTGWTTQFKGDIQEIGLKSTVKYNQKDFLLWGIDRKEFSQQQEYLFDYANNGIFFTNSNSFNRLVVTESVRNDTYNKFQDKMTGKLGVKYLFTEDIFLSSNYGTGYKAPSLYELSHDGGNQLKPEFTKSFDISGNYKDLKLTYFHNKIDDFIQYTDPTPTDYYNNDAYYENGIGRSIIKGYEITYQKNIFSDTLFTLGYTKQNAKDKDGITLGRVPTQLLKIAIDYYGINKLHIHANSTYIGHRYDFNGGPDAWGQNETGHYTVCNAIVNYELTKQLKTYIKLDNILDKKYQTVYGYTATPRSGYIGLDYTF